MPVTPRTRPRPAQARCRRSSRRDVRCRRRGCPCNGRRAPVAARPARLLSRRPMPPIRSVCVFCGSSSRVADAYRAAASDLGALLARQGVRLVYGGGRVGLMGILADAALAAGGEVIGVIPQFLVDLEVAHRGLTELRVVGSMHERKRMMAELADAFVALPGGFG